MTYLVKHLNEDVSLNRPAILFNEHEKQRNWDHNIDPAVEAFHSTLPHYGETKLHSLPQVATELGFSHVFIKDESTRFGLPSFKILGASWAIHQAICARLNVPNSTPLNDHGNIEKREGCSTRNLYGRQLGQSLCTNGKVSRHSDYNLRPLVYERLHSEPASSRRCRCANTAQRLLRRHNCSRSEEF